MTAVLIEDILPLSAAQEGMLFHSLFDDGPDFYAVQIVLHVDGPIDAGRMRAAAQQLLDRHASLRTGFVHEQVRSPLAAVARTVPVPWHDHDLQHLDETAQDAELRRILDTDRRTRFDLTEPPLLRLRLIRLAPHRHRLVLSNHHLLYDGWSLPIIMRDLFTIYRDGDGAALPPAGRYADYLRWLGAQDRAAARTAWRTHVLTGIEPTTLGGRHIEGADPRVQDREVSLDPATTEALGRLARRLGVTPATVLRGSWAVLLSRLTGRDDVVFGTTVADRPAQVEGADAMVGLCINTVPTRVLVRPETPVGDLLRTLQDTQSALLPHLHLGLPEIQRLAGNRELFDTLLVFQNYPLDLAALGTGTALRVTRLSGETGTHYPLSVTVFPGHRMRLQAKYRPDRLTGETADLILQCWQNVLRAMVGGPDRPVGRISLAGNPAPATSGAEHGPVHPVPDETVVTMFEQRAADRPGHPAVVTDTTTLGYGDLDRLAGELAGRLTTEHGIGPEHVVAIALPRSPELLIAVLGVLKAGAAYLPLDPAYPAARLQHMLDDARPHLVLTAAGVSVPRCGAPVARWEELTRSGTPAHPHPAGGSVRADHPAYLIFTSGTTGLAKAAAITHRALTNRMAGMQAEDPLGPSDRVLHKAALGFDAAVWEVLWTLTHGATLVLAGAGAERDPLQLVATIERHAVTVVHFVPSMLREFLPVAVGRCASLQRLLCGGERLTSELRDTVSRTLDVALHNRYGPTETAIHVTHHRVGAAETSIPLGSLVWNMRGYVLDHHLQPVPNGITGELYLAGPQLARGYHNHPGLTAHRFIADPHHPNPGQRMYRTGDLVHRDHHGHLHYHGRTDTQTKLRGHRIDTNEIDTILTTHPHITTTITHLREDTPGDQRLTTYLITTQPVPVHELRRFAADRLPAYLVPAAFVPIETLPVSPNGKLDRAALPAPKAAASSDVAARTPQEQTLASLFCEVLGVGGIGVDDDFFALGGHSLLATRLVSRVRSVFGVELAVRALFDAPTVAGLAALLGGADRARPLLVAGTRPATVPLSYAQQRLWFLNRMQNADPAYHVAFYLRLDGGVDRQALELALGDVVDRHETLRTVFPEVDGEPVQQVSAPGTARPRLAAQTLTEEDLPAFVAARSRLRFDLTTEHPIRAHLLSTAAGGELLLLVFHHIASDGWSMAPFSRDLALAYRARRAGAPPAWPSLDVQYVDYSLWQHALLGDPGRADSLAGRQLAFWRDALAGLPATLALPFDRPRPAVQSGRGALVELRFDSALHRAVVDLARAGGVSTFMALQASLAALLCKLGVGPDIPIGVPIAGRTDDALNDLVGFFVNTLVLRTDVGGDPSFRRLLDRVRRADLAAFDHQDLPFERLVAELNPLRSPGWHPLFQVMLTFNNTPPFAFDFGAGPTPVVPVFAEVAKFDLAVNLAEEHTAAGPGGITGLVEFNTDVFDRATVQTILERWRRLLASCTADPDRPLSRHDVLRPGERARLLQAGGADAPTEPAPGVLEQFERRVGEHPGRIAVTAPVGPSYTYAHVDEAANRLARHLIETFRVRPEQVVAAALPRTPDTVVALLAVLKTGAAYLPVDPDLPTARIALMMADARPAVVISTTAAVLPPGPTPALLLDAPETVQACAGQSAAGVGRTVHSSGSAYLIFTSGTTGAPKAVCVSHGALASYLAWATRSYPSLSGQAPLYSSLSFDLTVTTLFGPLVSGGTVHVFDALHDVPAGRPTGVTFLKATPSHLPLLLDNAEAWPVTGELVVGGEALRGPDLQRWRARHPAATVVNEYGPTEATVGCMEHRIAPGDPLGPGIVSLGSMAPGMRGYVLDHHLQPVPNGITGELYLAGPQLARGYHNHPGLTAHRFIADPHHPNPGQRMYRTGDLVHRDHHGHLHYHGRTDTQTKLRGHRIDTNEIDTILTTHPHITTTITHLREDTPGDQRLTTYLITTQPVDLEDVRAELVRALPEHLVPAHIVVLPALPLTATGKVDRAALPPPAPVDHVAVGLPRDAREQLLCRLVAEVLGVGSVGIRDDFFDLGGHSLLATQLIGRIRAATGDELSLRVLFANPTVAGFGPHLTAPARPRPALHPRTSA